MNSICFYNGKGGVGKTLLNELFASWLAYHERKRVALLDFTVNKVISSERRNEEVSLGVGTSWLSRYFARNPEQQLPPYDIIVPSGDVYSDDLTQMEGATRDAWEFAAKNASEYDYIIADFDAVYSKYSLAFSLLASHFMDLTVIPIGLDSESRREGLVVADNLVRVNGCNAVMVWNNIPLDKIRREGFLERGEVVFLEQGIEVLSQRVKTFAKASGGSDENLFVKSTLCWPERYVEMACPELPKLFREIRNRLDRM